MKKIWAYIFGGLLCFLLNTRYVTAQVPPLLKPEPPKNWHTLDLKTDGYFGISLADAYRFLQGKKSKPVLVAIIDSGVDTLQQDLQGILWVNPNEKPHNDKDDDHNGYVNDIHGWNFLGGPNGKADIDETDEAIRSYYKLADKYRNATAATAGNNREYTYWLQVKAIHDSTLAKSTSDLQYLKPELSALMISNGLIKQALNLGAGGSFNIHDLDKIQSKNDTLNYSKLVWSEVFKQEGTSTTNVAVIKDISDYIN